MSCLPAPAHLWSRPRQVLRFPQTRVVEFADPLGLQVLRGPHHQLRPSPSRSLQFCARVSSTVSSSTSEASSKEGDEFQEASSHAPHSRATEEIREAREDGLAEGTPVARSGGDEAQEGGEEASSKEGSGEASTTSLMPGSTLGALRRHSYYPRGFESMDKGERLLTWKSGLALAAVAAVVALKFQWLGVEVLRSALAIASGMVGVLLFPPFALGCFVLHLIAKLPDPILDKVVDATAALLTSATAAADFTSALLDLMPVTPVAAALAATWLLATLHENANPNPSAADLGLLVALVASLGYSVGVVSTLHFSAAVAGASLLSAVTGFVFSRRNSTEQGAPSKQPLPKTEKHDDSSTLHQLLLGAITPAAAAVVAAADLLWLRVGVLAAYCLGAGFLLSSRSQKEGRLAVPALISGVDWKAAFQRRSLSPYFLLKLVTAFTLVTAFRRLAFVLYLKAHGL